MPANFKSLASEITVLAVITLLSLRSFHSYFRPRITKPKAGAVDLYEDSDGKASEHSQKAYSVKLQKVFLGLLAAAGFTVTLVRAVFTTIWSWSALAEGWIAVSIWVRYPDRCIRSV
jgi:hypothetical protein